MPRFRIQSNLHLDGFQMLDACLENVTSFEGLDDKNDGRIVFLNGSSGNQSNLHPAVCYGRVFKGLAYLEDIDKITNGEGSLGTRVKALEDMLNVDSAETVVSTWEEIQAFLDNVKEGTDLMTMLDGKLDKTGGVMELDTIRSLEIKRKGSMSTIYFSNTNGALGFIGFNGSAQPIIADATGDVSNIILHEGNIGDYAAGGLKYADGIKAIDLNTIKITDGVIRFYYSLDNVSPNAPINTGGWSNSVLAIPLHTNGNTAQFFFGYGTADRVRLCFRYNYDQDWKTIAFTDSTVEAANRLANKVSLWGNEFDGTKSLGGRIVFSKGFAAMSVPIEDGGSNIEFLYVNPEGHLLLGQGLARNEKNTLIYGNNIKFCYGTLGTSANTAMTITDGGNVNIGTAFEGFKFSVYGGMTFLHGVESSALVLGQMPTNGLLVGNTNYGIGQWFQGGQGHIQASSFGNTTATAYALNLNPLGGAVNIASADASTNVLGELKLGSGTMGYINMVGSSVNYLWAANTIHIGLSTVGGRSGDNATLTIKGDSIHSGFRDNAVSLGTSSYRWSNVYSVKGDFSDYINLSGDIGNILYKGGSFIRFEANDVYIGTSAYAPSLTLGSKSIISFRTGNDLTTVASITKEKSTFSNRVLIGGAVDDADYALNVKGDSYFGGTVYIPTGQKLTIGDANGDHATIEYDSNAKAIKVDGNLFTTGTNASGGKADDQSGNTGGGSAEVYKYDLGRGEQVYEIQNVKGDVNVNIQVYEWNGNSNSWDMILTDVSVNETNITVTFGRPTSVDHMVTVV